MTYLGDPVSQLDGTWASHLNCVLAAASELGDCSSLGYWSISPSRLRRASGDHSGGVTYNTASSTMNSATGGEVKLTVLYWAPENSKESTLNNILDAPRVTGISIDAGVTRYTPFRTGTFTGGHTVTVGAKRFHKVKRSDGTTYTQKQAYVMDSGHGVAKWEWWPWSLLIKAAKSRTGGNSIHVLYTRDLANVTRTCKEDGAIRATTKVTSNPSNRVGAIVKDKAYAVVGTVKGSTYTLNGRTLNGWSKLGTNRYTVAKIR